MIRSLTASVLLLAATITVGCRPTAGPAAPQPARGSAATPAATLGIPPFRWSGEDPRLTALGFAMADLLVTDLSRSSQLQLVERSRLGELLREIDMAGAGQVDEASAPRVGKLLQANRLLLGTVDTLPSGDLRLGVRIADVETGVLAAALDARAPATDLLAAEKIMAFRLFDALGVTLSPAERSAVEDARTDASLAALTAYGEGVQAELGGDNRRAYDRYVRAGSLAPSFELARDRAAAMRKLSASAGGASTLLPGIRAIDAPVSGTVDRLNRPLDLITTFARPSSGAGDPAFPNTVITVIIQVRRP